MFVFYASNPEGVVVAVAVVVVVVVGVVVFIHSNPFLLPNGISTPDVRPDSSSQRYQLCDHRLR